MDIDNGWMVGESLTVLARGVLERGINNALADQRGRSRHNWRTGSPQVSSAPGTKNKVLSRVACWYAKEIQGSIHPLFLH